jgi:hypothetical protein
VNRKELALALGISGSMVSRLARRGMPTDKGLEAAEKWGRGKTEPAMIKGIRAGTTRAAPAVFGDVSNSSTVDLAAAAALARVRRLAQLAHDALAGNSFEIVAPMLRQALRAVSPTARPHVAMSLQVWDKLTEEIPGGGGGAAHDFSHEFMETFWYQIALGPLTDHAIVSGPVQPLQTRSAPTKGTGAE